MPLNPDALDYEDLFPKNRRPARDDDTFAENFRNPKKSSTYDQASESLVNTKAKKTPPSGLPPSGPTLPSTKAKSSAVLHSVASDQPIWRQGHSASFVGLFIFSVILYLRPYELIPALSSLTSMAFYEGMVTLAIYAFSQLSIEGNLTARPREINLVLLLGLAALLSMPLAVVPADAWKTFSELLIKTIIIFIVFVNVVRTELRLKLLLLLILAVSIYLSIGAINDYRQGLFLTGVAGTQDARIVGRIKGLFQNSNDLAMHLVSMIPIAVALGLSRAGLFRKLIYFGGAAIMVCAVIVTFSRGGFIGLVAAVLVLVRRLGRKNRTATTAALVFAVLLFLAFAPGAYSSRLSTVFNSSADVTGSSSQRTEVLKRSVWVTLRYPLFGVGIGNFRQKGQRNLETHNAYTQVSSEMGIAAMVVYIMFLVHPLKRLRLIENESYENPERRRFYYLSVGLQAALVGFMVSSFFGAVAYQWYVYYLVGYAVCLHRLFIMKFPPENGFGREIWEHPFSKETKKLIGGEEASQDAGAQKTGSERQTFVPQV